MRIPLEPGMAHTITETVRAEWTIAHYDKSLPPVLSTPAMIGLMEWAASELMKPHLGPGSLSVGTHINVAHSAATPVGREVHATARFRETDGRFFVFDVEVTDGHRLLGRGSVTRAIVDRSRFTQKIQD